MRNIKNKIVGLGLGFVILSLASAANAMQIFVETLTGKTITTEVEDINGAKLYYATASGQVYVLDLSNITINTRNNSASVPAAISSPYNVSNATHF